MPVTPPQHVSRTNESGVGSEAQARRVLHTAAGRHRAGLAATEEISQSGPGHNTHSTHTTHTTHTAHVMFALVFQVCVESV